MQHHEATPQAKALYDALIKRGVEAVLEYPDGYKQIDIAIPSAHIYIEINGIQHYDSPEQIISDLERTAYSDSDGFRTIPITNQIIETHITQVADALAQVVEKIQKN